MKVFNNKKLFYIGFIGVMGIVLLIYAFVSLSKTTTTSYNGEFNVTTPQMYISNFADIEPGSNDPYSTAAPGVDTQLDILTVNQTDGIPVSVQHIITIYAKALSTSESENINAGDYLDATKFYISLDNDGTLTEAEDKYYILNNKTTVLAKKYTETDGEIIAVRYYVEGQFLDAPSDDNSPVYAVDSYKVGLASDASMAYINNAEINITVKTQATSDSIDLSNWVTVDSTTMYSTGYEGTPIDTSDLSKNTTADEAEEPVVTEVTSVPDTDEEETAETTVPEESEAETGVVTTGQTEEEVAEAGTTVTETETTTEATTTTAEVTTTTEAPEAEEVTTTTADNRVYPEGMSINTGSVDLNVGDTYTFKVTFDPAGTTETGLDWNSSNTSVATVDSNGTVTATGAGTASISVTSVNGMVLTVYVNVKAEETKIYPEEMSIDTGNVTLNPGESYSFKVTFSPSNATETGLTWSSSDTSVATVDSNGTVTAVASGTASISVTSVNGMTLTVQVNVN